jgi:hypothetical protein
VSASTFEVRTGDMLQLNAGASAHGTRTARGAARARHGVAARERSSRRLAEAVLSGRLGRTELLARVADHLQLLADADLSLLAEVAADGRSLRVVAATGVGADHVRGAVIPLAATVVGEALLLSASGTLCPDTVIVADDLWDAQPDLAGGAGALGPAVIVPAGPDAGGLHIVVANLAARPQVGGARLDGLRASARRAALALRCGDVRRRERASSAAVRARGTGCAQAADVARERFHVGAGHAGVGEAAATDWWAWCRRCRHAFPVAVADRVPRVAVCQRCGVATTNLQAILSDRPPVSTTARADDHTDVA